MILALLVLAQAPSMTVEAGFRNRAHADSWVPVVARLRSADAFEGHLRVRVRNRFDESSIHRRRVSLAPRSDRRVFLEFFANGGEMVVTAELEDQEGNVVARAEAELQFAEDAQRRVLVAGEARLPGGFGTSVLSAPPDALPISCASLAAFDVVVVPRPVELSDGQMTAVRQWVDLGGRLVISGGRVAPEWRSWSEALGLELTGTVDVEVESRRIVLATGGLRGGREMPAIAGRSWGARAARGRGEIVFLSFSLLDPAAEECLPLPAIWGAALDAKEEEEEARQTRYVSTASLVEPVGNAAVRIGLGSIAIGAGLAGLYLLLVGPIGWLVLRRRAFRHAWLHFLVLVAVFTTVFVTWRERLAPPRARLWQVVFEDHGESASLVQTFSAFQADDGRTYEVNGHPRAALAILARPGEGIPESTVEDGTLKLPMPPQTLRTFASVRAGEAKVWCRRSREQPALLEVDNMGSRPLEECVLVVANRVHELGRVEAGERRSIDVAKTPWLPVEEWGRTLLMEYESRSVFGGGHVKPEHVGMAATFQWHLRPGFRTGWGHPSPRRPRQRGIDLSDLVEEGASVFVGRVNGDEAAISVDAPAETRTYAFVRVVVKP